MTDEMDKNNVTLNAFSQHAEAYEKKFDELKLYRHAFEKFAGVLGDNDRILDVGCGPGNVARYLLTQNATLRITGVDQSPQMIRLAQEKVSGASFEVRDMQSLHFQAEHFDAIVASFCLPFLFDDEALALLGKLTAMLKIGGHLYLSTMEGEGHRYEKTSFGGDTIFFFNYYRRGFLEAAFERNQLSIEMEWLQDYPKADGTAAFKDMLFILKKCNA